jgi:hypothetical protein
MMHTLIQEVACFNDVLCARVLLKKIKMCHIEGAQSSQDYTK